MGRLFENAELQELSINLGTMDAANGGSGYVPVTPPPEEPKEPVYPGDVYLTNYDSGTLSCMNIKFNVGNGSVGKTSATMHLLFHPGLHSKGIESIRVGSLPGGLELAGVRIISPTEVDVYMTYRWGTLGSLGNAAISFDEIHFDNGNESYQCGANTIVYKSFECRRGEDWTMAPGGDLDNMHFTATLSFN